MKRKNLYDWLCETHPIGSEIYISNDKHRGKLAVVEIIQPPSQVAVSFGDGTADVLLPHFKKSHHLSPDELEFKDLINQCTDNPTIATTNEWFEHAYEVSINAEVNEYPDLNVALKTLLEKYPKSVTETIYQNSYILPIELEPYARFIHSGGLVENANRLRDDGVFMAQGMTGTESCETPASAWGKMVDSLWK